MATVVMGTAGGSWNTDANWVGGVKPTAADDVLIGATVTANVTVGSGGGVCRSIDCTGFTHNLVLNQGVLSIGDGTAGTGNSALKFPTTMGLTSTLPAGISFVSTSATQQTIDANITSQATCPDSITFNGAGSSYKLLSPIATRSSGNALVSLLAGTLDTNGQNCAWGAFSSTGSTARTLTLGASTITISTSNSSSTGTWLVSGSNFTLNANTSTISLSGASASFSDGSHTYNSVSFTAINGNASILAALTCANLTIATSSNTSLPKVMNLAGNLTVTSTLTLTGNNAGLNRLIVQSDTFGTARTVTVTTTVTAQNVDFMDITGAGAASWNLSAITGGAGDAGGNSGITFTTATTRYAVVAGNWSATATWSASSGGAGGASVPLPQDAVVLNASSAAGTYTADMQRLGKDITCTGFTRTLAFSSLGTMIFGSVTLAAGMTVSGASTTSLLGRSSHTITCAGKAFSQTINIGTSGSATGSGPTYTMQDAFSGTTLTLNHGTFDANGFAVTLTTQMQAGNTSNTRVLNMGAGTWTLSGTGTVWNSPSGASLTLNASTSIIDLTNTTATAKTFAGGGRTFATLRYNVNSAASLTITGANTFDTLIVTIPAAGSARTLTLPASTTTTITGTLTLTGISGALLTVNSSTGGTAATFSKASGTVSADYLSLQDNTATGGAMFLRGVHSTVVSNVTGWQTAAQSSLLDAFLVNRRTKTASLDARLLARLIRTANLDAILLARRTRTHLLDAVLLSRRSKSSFLDGILLARKSAVTALDAMLLSRRSKLSSLDAIALARKATTAALDASLLSRRTRSSSADAVLLSRRSVTSSLDAVTPQRVTKSSSLDAVALAREAHSSSLDGAIVMRIHPVSSVDAIALRRATRQSAADAILLARRTRSSSIDAIALARSSALSALNGILLARSTVHAAGDAVLLARFVRLSSVDASLLSRSSTTAALDADLLARLVRSSSFDAIALARQSAQAALDAYVVGEVHMGSVLDAIALARQTKSSSLDAGVATRRTVASSVDAVALARRSLQSALDAIALARQTRSYEIDALLLARDAAAHMVDAVILARGAKTAALDASLLSRRTNTSSLDSIVLARRSVEQQIDAVLLASLTASSALDALPLARGTRISALDATLLARQRGTSAIDASLRATENVVAAVDAVILKRSSSSHFLEALLFARRQQVSSQDATLLARQRGHYSFSAIAKQRAIHRAHTFDAIVFRAPGNRRGCAPGAAASRAGVEPIEPSQRGCAVPDVVGNRRG